MCSVHVASSYHAAFLTQLVGMHECCMGYAQIFMENEAFAASDWNVLVSLISNKTQSCPVKKKTKCDSETTSIK